MTTRISDIDALDWRLHIAASPDVLSGKPVIRGTRLSVDFLLRLFANGWTSEQVLESYPVLTTESLRAVFAFAAEALEDEHFFPLHSQVA